MRNGTLSLSLLLSLVAACGGSSNPGPDGSTPPGVTPTANGVFPTQGFAGRVVHVEVSGDATDWDSSATLDFGSGVTAANITVASATDLEADLTIDPAATLGARDVTVTSHGTFTLKGAFSVASPVSLVFTGDVAQGGLPFFTITNLDFDNQFDTTADPNTGAFTNIQITSPAGVDMVDGISAVTAFQITGRAFIDVTATPGTSAVTVISGPTGGTQVTSSAGTATVTAATVTALTAGSDTTGMIAADGDSAVFSIAATGSGSASFFNLTVSSDDANAQPEFGALPDGTWASGISAPAIIDGAGSDIGTVDLVIGDGGAEGNYSFTINSSILGLTQAAEGNNVTDNTNATTTNVAAAAALPYEMTAGVLSSATDVDVIKLTGVPAGKHIHVTTALSDDTATDTAVDIQTSAGVSITGGIVDGATPGGDGGATCEDAAFFGGVCGEDVDSDATATAGTFFVQISAGAAFSTDDEDYVVVIYLD